MLSQHKKTKFFSSLRSPSQIQRISKTPIYKGIKKIFWLSRFAFTLPETPLQCKAAKKSTRRCAQCSFITHCIWHDITTRSRKRWESRKQLSVVINRDKALRWLVSSHQMNSIDVLIIYRTHIFTKGLFISFPWGEGRGRKRKSRTKKVPEKIPISGENGFLFHSLDLSKNLLHRHLACPNIIIKSTRFHTIWLILSHCTSTAGWSNLLAISVVNRYYADGCNLHILRHKAEFGEEWTLN